MRLFCLVSITDVIVVLCAIFFITNITTVHCKCLQGITGSFHVFPVVIAGKPHDNYRISPQSQQGKHEKTL